MLSPMYFIMFSIFHVSFPFPLSVIYSHDLEFRLLLLWFPVHNFHIKLARAVPNRERCPVIL